ncbi:MAG: SRPBCC family protein [Stappiaceae bacterium]
MSGSSIARWFLGGNAVFSSVCGLTLISAAGPVSEILLSDSGSPGPLILRLLGVGLLIFALDLALMAANKYVSRREVVLIVLADLGWVVGSALLVFDFGDLLTSGGKTVVELVAVIVGVFALGQLVGSLRINAPLSKVEMKRENGALVFRTSRVVDASAAKVWDIMNDHPAYADVASNISKVDVISGQGLGMVRRCFGPKGENWQETCNLFEDGRAFGFRVHTEAPDYPYPISGIVARWSVEPRANGTSEFTIDIEATPKGNFLSRSLFSLMAGGKFKTVLIDLAENWATKMETRARPEIEQKGRPMLTA